MADDIPTVLFGAFDRHNFGDLLFPHVVAALLPGRQLIHAGLATRDLRPYGGHQVRAIAELATELRDQPLNIVHVGGELLTCDTWQAAIMLQAPEQARHIVDQYDQLSDARMAWAQAMLGVQAQAPYCVGRELFPRANRVVYCAVGGVELAGRSPAMRSEVLAKLRSADMVSVRDEVTQGHLAAAIKATLQPDPAVMVEALCGEEIKRHAHRGEVARVRAAFPQGYLAVQLSADFGDDQTLGIIAAQLDAAAHAADLAIVLFRAGAAPWHDDLDCYRRLAKKMHAPAVWLFTSLHLWDICALIAHSRGYCGSSLHGRIVAMAYGLPRLNVHHPLQEGHVTKQDAYCATWELFGVPTVAAATEITEQFIRAMQVDVSLLQDHRTELVHQFRQAFAASVAA
ncbi:MAG: chromosome condensation regulator RCC1 [Gammaproteobacteria bacterium HGW-Gammaproteobacteria-1]|jgi:hypothetical protein|nr:MAG: chromosome condensation regulator RCC1 [Gammaproteobacteria bacterium HGW-Gammaproteobacteria-1]